MNGFKNDYKLSPADSARIQCGQCGKPATTGQNNGGAPFWYHCDECAEVGRQTDHFYRDTVLIRDNGNPDDAGYVVEAHPGAMTGEQKQEYRLDQQDEAERESQNTAIPFHVLPPVQDFTRRLRNQPLTLTYDVEHPGAVMSSLRCGQVVKRAVGGYSDRVTVTVDSGDPGGSLDEFQEEMQKFLSEWFDGAAVGLRPKNIKPNVYPTAHKGKIVYVSVPED